MSLDAFVLYTNEAGQDLFLQFDDDDTTRVQFTEGTGDSERRYAITNAELVTAGLDAGEYSPTARAGVAVDATGEENIIAAYSVVWDGATIDPVVIPPTAVQIKDAVWNEPQAGHVTPGTYGAYVDAAISSIDTGGYEGPTLTEIKNAVWDELKAGHVIPGSYGAYLDASVLTSGSGGGTGDAGGGTLSARIGVVSLTSDDYLEIVQGEQKILTIIVEAHGRFIKSEFSTIVVKIGDAAGTVITITEDNDRIIRVCEQLDVQVIRCVLSAEDTAELEAGVIQIEISFENQKAHLTHSVKVLEQLVGSES